MGKTLIWLDVVLWAVVGLIVVITGHPVYIRLLLGLLVIDTLLVRWIIAKQTKEIASLERRANGIGLM